MYVQLFKEIKQILYGEMVVVTYSVDRIINT